MNEREVIDRFVEKGLISEANRANLLTMQERSKRRLLTLSAETGMFSEDEIVDLLADLYGMEKVGLDDLETDLSAFEDLVGFFAANQAVPLSGNEQEIRVALFDPTDAMLVRSMEMGLGKRIAISLAPQKEISRFWDAYFKADEVEEDDVGHMIDIASEAPVVRVVSDIMSRAIELSASDIHLEPKGSGLKLRYRIDGMLHDFPPPPSGMGPAIISRIKILSNLDIAERRAPQDGAIKLPTAAKEVDVRVSIIPTVHGEGVVLRILDKGKVNLDFSTLGISGPPLEMLQTMLEKSYGMVVVAGPTGAGKTTSLYAALTHMQSESRKIITIEDPVEYKLPAITQIQVNPKAGLTFADGLRSILRHDPDVMLVGEIRDAETAAISVQSALTGHLVLSTLHANRAAQVFGRLLDMGVEAFLASAAILGAMSQRLVRKLCGHCREEEPASAATASKFGLEPGVTLYRSPGCDKCNHTGFRGRMGIYEVLPMNDEVQQLVLSRAPANRIEEAAAKAGFSDMVQDGVKKALAGQTTLSEVARVVG